MRCQGNDVQVLVQYLSLQRNPPPLSQRIPPPSFPPLQWDFILRVSCWNDLKYGESKCSAFKDLNEFQGNPSKNKKFRLLSRAGFSCYCFLHHNNPSKSTGPDALRLSVLGEMAFMRLFPIKFESSQRLREVLNHWGMVNLPSVFKKCWIDAQRNYRLVRLTLISGKVVKQHLSEHISVHMKEKVELWVWIHQM